MVNVTTIPRVNLSGLSLDQIDYPNIKMSAAAERQRGTKRDEYQMGLSLL